MVLQYKGYNLFALPRDGGFFVRLKSQRWPIRHREAPFVETAVFSTEQEAIGEATRLLDCDSWRVSPGRDSANPLQPPP